MRFPKTLRGEQRLVVVFWLYCILGSALALALPFLFAEWLYDQGFPMWGFRVIEVAEAAFVVLAHVSLWLCAFNSRHRWIGYAARVYSLVAVALFFFPVAFYQKSPTIEVDIVSDR
jgi:hypothetical protein